jgi:uncharacterized membrane protein
MFFSSKLGLSDVWQSIRRIVRILWVRVALISALSLAASLSAPLVEAFVPESWKQRFSEEATLPILNVLASSLLAVATFSLGIMVSSHRALAEQTTPRVHQILMEDTRTQTVIATFIGGFVYALSSIILFRAQVYGFDAAVVVFTTSSLVVLVIVLSLIRWIEHLSRIGSLTYALDQAEISAKRVLDELRLTPRYGGASCDAAKDKSADGEVIKAARCGYVLRFQMAGLQKQAQRDESRVIIDVMPGDHVLTGQQVARLIGGGDVARYREHIVIGGKRSHDQDPLYALQALRESGSKALSPGINDAGTATEVVTRLERLLWASFAPAEETPDVLFDRVHVREVAPGAMLTTSFRHIARDGKHLEEVVSYVARTVMRLSDRVKDDAAVDALLRDIDAYAKDGLITEGELRRYEDVRNP